MLATCFAHLKPIVEILSVESGGPDYIVDKQTRHFVLFPAPSTEEPGRFPPIDYCDTTFIKGFQKPGSYSAPDGETWRLYPRRAEIDHMPVYVIVGSQLKALSKVELECTRLETVDASLMRDANQIAAELPDQRSALSSGRHVLTVDGFVVVEQHTGRVVRWGWWLPQFLSTSAKMPVIGLRPYIFQRELYVLRTDATERILAASIIPIANVPWLLGLCGGEFLITAVIS